MTLPLFIPIVLTVLALSLRGVALFHELALLEARRVED